MSIADRAFWFFALAFFLVGMLVAIYLHEVGIAAFMGFMLGTAVEKFDRVVESRNKS